MHLTLYLRHLSYMWIQRTEVLSGKEGRIKSRWMSEDAREEEEAAGVGRLVWRGVLEHRWYENRTGITGAKFKQGGIGGWGDEEERKGGLTKTVYEKATWKPTTLYAN